MAFDTDVSWYLFPWRNANSDNVIASIEVVPAGPRFVLAGITLGLLDEDPFRHDGARDVVIRLPRSEDAASTADLSVDVDRGLASYTQPLPDADAATFLADPLAGWGEARATAQSPAARAGGGHTIGDPGRSPSATRRSATSTWSTCAGEPVAASPRVEIELTDPGRNWVRTMVVDDATGEPVPCRIHFRSVQGVPYAPHGHHAHVNSGTPARGTRTSGGTFGSARSPTPTSTARARAGCRAAR